jgi:hypothetical protein
VTINSAELSSTSAAGTPRTGLLTRADSVELANPFASLLLDHRARVAALSGRYDEAAADLECIQAPAVPSVRGDQYSFARAVAAAEIARAVATASVRGRRCAERWCTRERADPALCVAARLAGPACGDRGVRARARPRVGARGAGEPAGRDDSAGDRHRALADAEIARAAGREPDWTAALEACRAAEDP